MGTKFLSKLLFMFLGSPTKGARTTRVFAHGRRETHTLKEIEPQVLGVSTHTCKEREPTHAGNTNTHMHRVEGD